MPGVLRNIGLLGCAWLGVRLAAAGAQPLPEVPEAELKAALVYNFAVFTEWPPQFLAGETHLHVCIPAESPLRDALLRLQARTVNGRPLRLQVAPDEAERRHCRIWLSAPPPALSGPGVLTVADGGEAGAGAAVITLVVEQQHVRFDVDTGAARAAGLRLSSKLLRLARRTR